MTDADSKSRAHGPYMVASACVVLMVTHVVVFSLVTNAPPVMSGDAAWCMTTRPGILENVTIPPIEPDLETADEVDDSGLDPVLEFFPTDQEVREAMSDISSGRFLKGVLVILKLFLIPLALFTASGLIILNWRRKSVP